MTNPSAQTMLADSNDEEALALVMNILQRVADMALDGFKGDGVDESQTLCDINNLTRYTIDALAKRTYAASAPAAVREALVEARKEIVLAIAFLGRDAGSDRLQATITGLIQRLSKADVLARAALCCGKPSHVGNETDGYTPECCERFTLPKEAVALQDSLERAANALQSVYDWYDRDGSAGGACAVFEENRRFLNIVRPAPPAAQTDGVSAVAQSILQDSTTQRRADA